MMLNYMIGALNGTNNANNNDTNSNDSCQQHRNHYINCCWFQMITVGPAEKSHMMGLVVNFGNLVTRQKQWLTTGWEITPMDSHK